MLYPPEDGEVGLGLLLPPQATKAASAESIAGTKRNLRSDIHPPDNEEFGLRFSVLWAQSSTCELPIELTRIQKISSDDYESFGKLYMNLRSVIARRNA